MDRLMFRHFGRDDRVDFVALFTACENIAFYDALIQVRALQASFWQVPTEFVRFMRYGHMSSGMALLSALLLPGFLPEALWLRFIDTITGWWPGTILGGLVQLALKFLYGFLQFLDRFCHGSI